MYWDVVDDLQLTFGLRYTEEEKSSLQRTIFLSFQSDPNAPGGGYDEFESDSQELTGKFNLNYAPVDDVLLFATASRSYKSGGFNPITRANAEMLGVSSEYDPEFINSAEIGAKMRLVGNTLQANLTGFYYDFEDLQVGRIAGQTAINENTDAEVMGFEGEFLWAPSERWQATVNLSYLDTELGEFITIDTADPNQMGTTAGIISTGLSNVVLACSTPAAQCLGIPVNVEGNELPGAPQFTAYAALRYTWPLANGMHASASANYYYQDEFFTRIHNTADDLLDEWDIWNASLSLSGADEDWYAELWVRNIQDEDHWTGQRLLDPGLGLFRTFQLLEPRTYGLTFGISF